MYTIMYEYTHVTDKSYLCSVIYAFPMFKYAILKLYIYIYNIMCMCTHKI